MADYSEGAPPLRSSVTIYGVDSAIVIVLFAALLFWAGVGTAVWLFLSR